MLTLLQLRDFAIVDRAELEFGAGLTALTGETGAGKSIIVDALVLAAGGRAASDIVRHGAERAEVAASFAVPGGGAERWLLEQSIDHQGEVMLRRVVGADGRSRAYLNGQLVSLQALREFADFAIEIHGQQEFQHLVNRSAQRELLDAHGVPAELLQRTAQVYARYAQCRADYDAVRTAAEQRDARIDFLQYQLAEMKAAVTTPEEIAELLVDQRRAANRGKLAEATRAALDAVYESDGGNASALLGKALAAIRSHADADRALAEAAKLLSEAQVAAREAARSLQHYADALDVDPARQEQIERRVAALESLARKHRVAIDELPAQLARTEHELADLQHAGVRLTELQTQIDALAAQYRAVAAELSGVRRRAAQDLAERISALMQTLGMVGGRFQVELASAPSEFSAHGTDQIEFLVSANPGQPPKPLARVASGGELSRISLAVQVAAAAQRSPLCMVFDEVDAGVGGAVAEIVGRQLRELGDRAQVLCVTHLPQVASQAHVQFKVSKLSDGKTTRTSVNALSPDERVEEIARMLGGVSLTERAREHAREMLAHAEITPIARARIAGTKPARILAAPKKSRGRPKSV